MESYLVKNENDETVFRVDFFKKSRHIQADVIRLMGPQWWGTGCDTLALTREQAMDLHRWLERALWPEGKSKKSS